MPNLIRINCKNSTYVNKSHLDTIYANDDHLLVALLRNTDSKINVCISLLTFPMLNLEPKDILNAYLYLFLEDINHPKDSGAKIRIIGNFDYIDTRKINWSNFPTNNFSNEITSEIYHDGKNSYIKIDVTPIISVLSKFDINYNLIISPIISSIGTFIKLSSYHSDNPPYLVIEKYKNISNSETHPSEELSESKDSLENIYKHYINNSGKHLNIDFDYTTDTNPNISNDSFKSIIEKIDNISSRLINNMNNFDEKLSNFDYQFTASKNLLNDLSGIIEKLNNKTDDINKSTSSPKHILEDLSNILKNVNNKVDILDNNFPSSNSLIKNFSSIIKNINNNADAPNDNVEKSDNKIDNLFEILKKNTSILYDAESNSNNIISILDIIKDTLSTQKNTSDTTDDTLDYFDETSKMNENHSDSINSKLSVLTNEINKLCELLSSIVEPVE